MQYEKTRAYEIMRQMRDMGLIQVRGCGTEKRYLAK